MATKDELLKSLSGGKLQIVDARPFTPFRLHMSDGGVIDVVSRELVLPGRRMAVIGLLDPGQSDSYYDRWTTASYMHVTRHEMLPPGAAPFAAPPPGEVPSPV